MAANATDTRMLGRGSVSEPGETVDLATQLRQGDLLRIRAVGCRDEELDLLLMATSRSMPTYNYDQSVKFVSWVLFGRRGRYGLGTDYRHIMLWGSVDRYLVVGHHLRVYNRVPLDSRPFSDSGAPHDYSIDRVSWAQVDW